MIPKCGQNKERRTRHPPPWDSGHQYLQLRDVEIEVQRDSVQRHPTSKLMSQDYDPDSSSSSSQCCLHQVENKTRSSSPQFRPPARETQGTKRVYLFVCKPLEDQNPCPLKTRPDAGPGRPSPGRLLLRRKLRSPCLLWPHLRAWLREEKSRMKRAL